MSDEEKNATNALIRSAIEHIGIRPREYDKNTDTVRVKRKFAETIAYYLPGEVIKTESGAYWQNRANSLQNKNDELLEENRKLREKINNNIAFNWAVIAEGLVAERDELKKILADRGRLLCEVTRCSRKWRERALKAENRLSSDRIKGAVYYGKSWRFALGEKEWRDKIKNIDTRLRAWSDTPCDSADELRAMAVLVESIKSAARLVARSEEE